MRNGRVFVMSGNRGSILQAIDLAQASGPKAIAWQHERDTSYVPSPLLYGDSWAISARVCKVRFWRTVAR